MDEHRDLGGKLNITGKIYAIYGGLNTVGRNKEAVVNIKSLSVSQHHAMLILVDDDLHFISDLKSSNGTFLNGRKLAPLQIYKVENGAHIMFGNIEGTYSKCSEGSKLPTPNDSQCTQQFTQTFYRTDTQIMDETHLNNNQNQNSNYIPTQELAKVASALESSYEKLHEQETQKYNKTQLGSLQNSSYIPTQVLVRVASELESSYENLHEQQTQLLSESQNIHEIQNVEVNQQSNNIDHQLESQTAHIHNLVEKSTCDIDQSIIDLHEAETQKMSVDNQINSVSTISGNELDIHEMETQIPPEEKENASHNMPENVLTNVLNASQSSILEGNKCNNNSNCLATNSTTNFEGNETINPAVENTNASSSLSQNTQGSDKVNPLGKCRNVLTESQTSFSENLNINLNGNTQDSDQVHPLGKCNNILTESQNSLNENVNINSDDNESEIIRPVKKSVNVFDFSQESVEDEPNADSNDSIDFLTMQKINDAEKKYFKESNNVEPSSVMKISDELAKMKNTNSTSGAVRKTDEKKQESTFVDAKTSSSNPKVHTESEEIKNCTAQDEDSETDIEKEDENEASLNACKQKTGASDSETDIEEDRNKRAEAENENITNQLRSNPAEKDMYVKRSEISDSETDLEKKENESSSDSEIGKKKKKKSLKRNKRNNAIVDSDSESDIEVEPTKKSPKKSITSRFESAINLEKQNAWRVGREKKQLCIDSGSDTDIENDKENTLQANNSIASSVFNVSEQQMIDETTYGTPQKEASFSYAKKKDSLQINESLNDSDFIPATQDAAGKTIKTMSQNSRFENSEESFKLGLTQLMEDDITENQTSQQKTVNERSNNAKESELESMGEDKNAGDEETSSQNRGGIKKFVFKKHLPSDTTNHAAVPFEDQDDEIYGAQTQKLCDEATDKPNISNDDHIFLQPSQKLPTKKKNNKDQSASEDDIYMLSTQKFDGSPTKSNVEDIYLQSTQKLTAQEDFVDPGEGTSKMGLPNEDIYLEATQKLTETDRVGIVEMKKITPKLTENDDFDDMFASQAVSPKTTPSKYLESELEHMFATQRAIPSDDSLDKIKDIVLSKEIVDTKLPEEDSDLEAILATQRQDIEAPQRQDAKEVVLGHSIESQLEVIFTSQITNLPPDKFERPTNPLVNIFGEETQETESAMVGKGNVEKVKTTNDHSVCDMRNKSTDKSDLMECSSMTSGRYSHNGLEQSFALLEAKSTKIRRSARNTNYEEVTVSCPKSRKSMCIAPNEKFEKFFQEKVSTKGGQRRTKIIDASNSSDEDSHHSTRRSRSTTINNKTRSDLKKQQEDKDDDNDSVISNSEVRNRSVTQKKRKTSESSNVSDDARQSAGSNSSRSTRTSRFKKIVEIQDDDNSNSALSNSEMKEPKGKGIMRRKAGGSKLLTISEDNSCDSSRSAKASRSKKRNTSEIDTPKTSRGKSVRIESGKELISRSSSNSSISENHVSTSSSTVKRGSSIEVTTPSKTRRLTETTPSTSRRKTEVLETPSRYKRKQKPKVVFTMMDNPHLESAIRQLGGSVVDSVDTCTVLVTHSVKRTMKLLSAVGQGKPICSSKWIEASKKENEFVDPWDYILIDKEAETKWDFSLKISLERSSQTKLLQGYTFQLLVTTALDVLKGAIEHSGGKIVTRSPKGAINFVVVSSPDQEAKYKKLLKQHPNLMVIEPEAIFDGVLRQEIRFERHLLN